MHVANILIHKKLRYDLKFNLLFILSTVVESLLSRDRADLSIFELVTNVRMHEP